MSPFRPRTPISPALYQLNTRVRLTELAESLGRPATLDDIPDAELGRLAAAGFDWIWLLSVWQTGEAGGRISRANRAWRREFEATLPDLREADIAGSGFAIAGYQVPAALGGDAALARLRERLRRHGLRLMLDFVPNHTALDHRWVEEHPDYYVAGSERDLAGAPDNYVRLAGRDGERILAHGRDPNFPGWADTLQLDYGNPALQAAMRRELLKVARQCDGLRCDMAMLILPEVFERSWGIAAAPFWPRAIAETRREAPGFCFMAEVYWDLEATILSQGFDYAYDKRLYDRLVAGEARPVREHLAAEPGYQRKLARFLENHDERRAAAVFPPGRHEAAAAITYLLPGMRFFHQGQLEGRRRRVSPHLVRAPHEPVDETIWHFYQALLAALREPALGGGDWRPLDCAPAWDGNGSWDGCLAWCWEASGGQRILVAVNYAGHQSQCYVRLPWPDLAGRAVRLADLLSAARYERDGTDLTGRGLYLDLPPWGRHAFVVTAPV